MTYINHQEVTIVTDGSGNGTGYTEIVNGFIQSIRYVKGNYSNGVDFSVTAEGSGLTIWAQNDVNASAMVSPRVGTCDTGGTAALYAAAGSPVGCQIPVANERISIAVSSGGNAMTGTFHVYIGG